MALLDLFIANRRQELCNRHPLTRWVVSTACGAAHKNDTLVSLIPFLQELKRLITSGDEQILKKLVQMAVYFENEIVHAVSVDWNRLFVRMYDVDGQFDAITIDVARNFFSVLSQLCASQDPASASDNSQIYIVNN